MTSAARVIPLVVLLWAASLHHTGLQVVHGQKDEWCTSVPDGVHSDSDALPPCSGYFSCLGGQLAEVNPCPQGMCYETQNGRCQYKKCNCPAGQGRPPMVYQNSTRWRQVNALLAFKTANRDPGGKLKNWIVPRTPGSSPQQGKGSPSAPPQFVCSWAGVKCKKGSVTELTLVNALLDYGDGEADVSLRLPPNGTIWGKPEVGQSIPTRFSALTDLEVLDFSYLGAAGQGNGIFGGLIGPIPPEIGTLTRLTSLQLKYNRLSGPVPRSISNLKKLQSLDIKSNSFSGILSETLSGLSSLEILDLSYNNFTGSIPSSLGSMASLAELHINFTPINSSIPWELGRLPKLSLLRLTSNPYISGSIPSSLSSLTSLNSMELRDMPLTGFLGNWISSLSSLQSIQISNTNISGTIPTTPPPSLIDFALKTSGFWGRIPAAFVLSFCSPNRTGYAYNLDFSDNGLEGSFPRGLDACPELSAINLSNNNFSGWLPKTMKGFKKLVDFNIANNSFSGPLPPDIFTLPNALSWDVSGNNFSGQTPELPCHGEYSAILLARNNLTGDIGQLLRNLSDCPASLEVDISGNSFYGQLPEDFITGQMGRFSASQNLLSGDLPDVRNCTTLLNMALGDNRLSGTVPAAFTQDCGQLQNLDLSNNRFSGSFPEMSTNSTLISLRASGNAFTGPVPASLSTLEFLTFLDLSKNNFSGVVPSSVAELPRLQTLDLSGNFLEGEVPSSIAQLLFLTLLSLGSNNLQGPIPPSIAPPQLSALVVMNLSRNSLSGPIPYGFANGTDWKLQLDLSWNNLSGPVPGGPWGPLSSVSVDMTANPFLCGGASYAPCPEPAPGAPPLSTGQIVGIAIGVSVGLSLIGFALWYFLWRGDKWSRGLMLLFQVTDPPLTGRAIYDLTDGFSDEFCLGRGGFGSVYLVTLANGTQLAVKRLNLSSSQGEKEFRAEVQSLGSLSHRNLVKLYAAYIAFPPYKERLLVYEYLSGGSLDQVLGEELPEGSPYCDWTVRLSILQDAARGMRYLHYDCKPGIFHRDMKPANILMGADFVARVADFGLAKAADLYRSHMSGEVMGTIGFIAPEYVCLGRMGFKSDVYAFGVTMLQIVTGRPPTDPEIQDKGIARWVGLHAASAIVDPAIVFKEGEMDQALGTIQLALRCIQRVPVDRPTMEEVSHTLDNMDEFARGIRGSLQRYEEHGTQDTSQGSLVAKADSDEEDSE